MTDIGTSYASLDGAATTIIVVAEEDRKKYGLKEQGAVGSITTATFRTLKGAQAFVDERITWVTVRRLPLRQRVRDSKAKRPVYEWVLKYDYRDYEKRMFSTPITELDEFFS